MGTVEHLRPNGQEVEEAWNGFRLIVRQGLADQALWKSAAWLERYAAAESKFNDLYCRWQPTARAR